MIKFSWERMIKQAVAILAEADTKVPDEYRLVGRITGQFEDAIRILKGLTDKINALENASPEDTRNLLQSFGK